MSVYSIYLPFDENQSSNGLNFIVGLVNALVFVMIVLVMTTLLVILFKYKCYRVRMWCCLIGVEVMTTVVSSVGHQRVAGDCIWSPSLCHLLRLLHVSPSFRICHCDITSLSGQTSVGRTPFHLAV